MIRNNILSRFIVVTLTAALLLVTGSRAIRVSALADPVIEDVAPVYDTVIYQLRDYVEDDLTEPQYEIFALLWGLYTANMAGAEDYQLENPYETQDGVLNWLKGLGVDAYNTLIGLAPDTVRLPDGSILNTVPIKEKLTDTIAIAMGMAVTASQYDDLDDFMDDVDDGNRSHYWIPFSDVTMYGMNSIFETYGGIYAWQFKTQPFDFGFQWNTSSLGTLADEYNRRLNDLGSLRIHANTYSSDVYNLVISPVGYSQFDLFLNSSNNKMYAQQVGTPTEINFQYVGIKNGTVIYGSYPCSDLTVNISSFSTYIDAVNTVLSNPLDYRFYNFYVAGGINLCYPDYASMFPHIYVGDSWVNRHELYNVESHGLEESSQPYYLSPDTQTLYYIDIKGMLQDLINNTNLMRVFIQNIYTPDGVLVHDTDLIRVSLRLLQDYELQNPPVPVNLNDIADYTDNSYLDRVKEEARRGGNVLAALVAFWHNCDPEIIYVLFGAGITVLVGAFVGKWGHS